MDHAAAINFAEQLAMVMMKLQASATERKPCELTPLESRLVLESMELMRVAGFTDG